MVSIIRRSIIVVIIGILVYLMCRDDIASNATHEAYLQKHKNIWIIGCSSGIGKSLATRLSRFVQYFLFVCLSFYSESSQNSSLNVFLSSRRVSILETLKNEIESQNPQTKPFVYPLDVTDLSALNRTYFSIVKTYGEIDTVIYNAGVNQKLIRLQNLSSDFADLLLKTNLIAPIHTFHLLVHSQTRGHLISISSLAAQRSYPGGSIYGGTKAGLSSFMDGLRMELSLTEFQVTDIQPGVIDTPGIADMDIPRPCQMSADEAAGLIWTAIVRNKSFYGFPFLVYWSQVFLGLIPNAIYDPVIQRIL